MGKIKKQMIEKSNLFIELHLFCGDESLRWSRTGKTASRTSRHLALKGWMKDANTKVEPA